MSFIIQNASNPLKLGKARPFRISSIGAAGTNGTNGTSAYTLLETKTISGSPNALDFVSNIDATYDVYTFDWRNVQIDTNAYLRVRMSIDGGATFDSTAGKYATYSSHSDTSPLSVTTQDSADNILPAPFMAQAFWTQNGAPISGFCKLIRPADGATEQVKLKGRMIYPTRGADRSTEIWPNGKYESTAAVDAIRFYLSAGAFISGTVKMYGGIL